LTKEFVNGAVLICLLIFLSSGCLGDSAGPGGASAPDITQSPVVTEAPVTSGDVSEIVAAGENLFLSKQCAVCHKLDGSPFTGPSLKGVFERRVTLLDGTSLTADEAYLRESIIDPDAKIVEGFNEGVMASFVLPGSISAEEADALIAYLKTL
jgi:cytochrome c oxidase subunit 2